MALALGRTDDCRRAAKPQVMPGPSWSQRTRRSPRPRPPPTDGAAGRPPCSSPPPSSSRRPSCCLAWARRRSVQATGPGFVLKFVTGDARQGVDSLAPMIRVYHDNVADPATEPVSPLLRRTDRDSVSPVVAAGLRPAAMRRSTMAGGKVTPALAPRLLHESSRRPPSPLTVHRDDGTPHRWACAVAGDPPAPASVLAGRLDLARRVGQTACRLGAARRLGPLLLPARSRATSWGRCRCSSACSPPSPCWPTPSSGRALAGACLALCCVIKPQLAVVLLWGVVRRPLVVRRRIPGRPPPRRAARDACASGWTPMSRTPAVLQSIGSHGEVFWPNQSANGFVSRLLENGHPLQVAAQRLRGRTIRRSTARRRPTAAVLLLASLVAAPEHGPARGSPRTPSWPPPWRPPVAWEHHLRRRPSRCSPCALGGLIRQRPLGHARPEPAGRRQVSCSMASAFLRPDILFASRWTGMAGLHLFVVRLVLFGLLHGPEDAASDAPARRRITRLSRRTRDSMPPTAAPEAREPARGRASAPPW